MWRRRWPHTPLRVNLNVITFINNHIFILIGCNISHCILSQPVVKLLLMQLLSIQTFTMKRMRNTIRGWWIFSSRRNLRQVSIPIITPENCDLNCLIIPSSA